MLCHVGIYALVMLVLNRGTNPRDQLEYCTMIGRRRSEVLRSMKHPELLHLPIILQIDRVFFFCYSYGRMDPSKRRTRVHGQSTAAVVDQSLSRCNVAPAARLTGSYSICYLLGDCQWVCIRGPYKSGERSLISDLCISATFYLLIPLGSLLPPLKSGSSESGIESNWKVWIALTSASIVLDVHIPLPKTSTSQRRQCRPSRLSSRSQLPFCISILGYAKMNHSSLSVNASSKEIRCWPAS